MQAAQEAQGRDLAALRRRDRKRRARRAQKDKQQARKCKPSIPPSISPPPSTHALYTHVLPGAWLGRASQPATTLTTREKVEGKAGILILNIPDAKPRPPSPPRRKNRIQVQARRRLQARPSVAARAAAACRSGRHQRRDAEAADCFLEARRICRCEFFFGFFFMAFLRWNLGFYCGNDIGGEKEGSITDYFL